MKLFSWVNKKLKPVNPVPAPVATCDLGRLQAKDASCIGMKQLGWQREELHRNRRELQALFRQELDLAPKSGNSRYPCGNASSLLAIGTLGAMQEEEAEEEGGFEYLSGGGGDGSGGGSGGALMTESELHELQEALQRALLAAANVGEKPTAANVVEKVPSSSHFGGGKVEDGGEATKKEKKKGAAKTKKEASAAANLAKKAGLATSTDSNNIPANNLFKKQSLLHRFSKACSKKVNPAPSQAKLSPSDSDMKYWRSDHEPPKSILNWKNVHPPSTLRSKKPPPPTTVNSASASVAASAHRSKLAKFLQAFRKGKKSQVCPAPTSSSVLQQHISSGVQAAAAAGYGHARLSAFERRGVDYPVSDYALDVLGGQIRLQLRNGREDDYSNEEEEEEDGSTIADQIGTFCDEYAYRLRHRCYDEEDEEAEEDMEMEMDDLDYTIQWLIKNDQEYWIKTDDEYVVLEL